MKTVLGIDLGTQSLKVVFYDYAARAVAASARGEAAGRPLSGTGW